jgi:DNA/RNA-binding domain of Phe-tRNA-synthetase-like protein
VLPLIESARVEPAIWDLHPDYQVILIEADGLTPGPPDAASEAALRAAETTATERLAGREIADVPEIIAWRDAYRSFGAKPQRTRPSVEALLRRLDSGLPRVDRLTDVYNAVSIAQLLPVGGEDLAAYVGPPVLTRATGAEPFDTTASGEPVTEHPDQGEVIWRDDARAVHPRLAARRCRRPDRRDRTPGPLATL